MRAANSRMVAGILFSDARMQYNSCCHAHRTELWLVDNPKTQPPPVGYLAGRLNIASISANGAVVENVVFPSPFIPLPVVLTNIVSVGWASTTAPAKIKAWATDVTDTGFTLHVATFGGVGANNIDIAWQVA